jgi:hypothetical protein
MKRLALLLIALGYLALVCLRQAFGPCQVTGPVGSIFLGKSGGKRTPIHTDAHLFLFRLLTPDRTLLDTLDAVCLFRGSAVLIQEGGADHNAGYHRCLRWRS